MTPPKSGGLVGEERIRELVQKLYHMDHEDADHSAYEPIVRQAVREAAEECAKIADDRIAFMRAHCNQDGINNGPDMFADEIDALTDLAAAIRARV
jgi:hypothetical protein